MKELKCLIVIGMWEDMVVGKEGSKMKEKEAFYSIHLKDVMKKPVWWKITSFSTSIVHLHKVKYAIK